MFKHIQINRLTPCFSGKWRQNGDKNEFTQYYYSATRRKIVEISSDGAYGTRDCHAAFLIKRAVALIPSREGAAFWEQGHPHNLAVGYQKLYSSNKKWKMRYGYHKHSLSETAMYRVKQLPYP